MNKKYNFSENIFKLSITKNIDELKNEWDLIDIDENIKKNMYL